MLCKRRRAKCSIEKWRTQKWKWFAARNENDRNNFSKKEIFQRTYDLLIFFRNAFATVIVVCFKDLSFSISRGFFSLLWFALSLSSSTVYFFLFSFLNRCLRMNKKSQWLRARIQFPLIDIYWWHCWLQHRTLSLSLLLVCFACLFHLDKNLPLFMHFKFKLTINTNNWQRKWASNGMENALLHHHIDEMIL